MKKHLLAAGVAATVGLSAVGAGVAHAATTNSASTDPMSSMVDKIATKFNLNKADVQKVFDEQKTEMQAERGQKVKDEVAQLVKDGKLTQAQADAINAKRAEVQKDREANRDAMKDKTQAERKAEMDKKKAELEAWAKQQGIDSQYLRYVMGGGPGHGHGPGGPGGHRGDNDGDSDSQSAATTQ